MSTPQGHLPAASLKAAATRLVRKEKLPDTKLYEYNEVYYSLAVKLLCKLNLFLVHISLVDSPDLLKLSQLQADVSYSEFDLRRFKQVYSSLE